MTNAAEVNDPCAALLALARAPHEQQSQLAKRIAFDWAKRDINAMWNAVARSHLDPQIKQIIYNQLWG